MTNDPPNSPGGMTYRHLLSLIRADLALGDSDPRLDTPITLGIRDGRGDVHFGYLVSVEFSPVTTPTDDLVDDLTDGEEAVDAPGAPEPADLDDDTRVVDLEDLEEMPGDDTSFFRISPVGCAPASESFGDEDPLVDPPEPAPLLEGVDRARAERVTRPLRASSPRVGHPVPPSRNTIVTYPMIAPRAPSPTLDLSRRVPVRRRAS